MRLRHAYILLFLVITSSVARGATLDDYRARLNAAAGQLHGLAIAKGVPSASGGDQMIERILGEVPVTEKVEWPGSSVETDNAWLAAELNAYRAEGDPTRRSVILTGAEQRLRAAEQAIGELQAGLAAGSTKDADKQKLAEILRRPEYQPPSVEEESLFQKWWKAFLKWLDDLFPSPNLSPSESLGLGSLRLVLQVLVFVVAAGLIGFLLWRFLPYFSARFRKRGNESRGDRVILGEIVGSDESGSDIFSEAERLARDGDIRGAIRKGYIAALCELADRRVVRLSRSKTNRDYLRDVRRTPNAYEGFRSLTDNYERNWYGVRTAEQADWDAFREGYSATLKEARGNAQ